MILIFPEGITNIGEINQLDNNLNKISNQLTDKTKIILGITLDDGEKIFNSLAIFDKQFNLENKYIKNKLVPFGEFLPFENFFKRIGLKKITQGYQPFSADNKREILEINQLKFIPLICYEIIYSGKINPNKKYYDFILYISEDGWFG